jgi:ABC-type enterochelin transport system substrate-binding protein
MTKVKRNYTEKNETKPEVKETSILVDEPQATPAASTKKEGKKKGRRPSRARQQFLENQKAPEDVVPTEPQKATAVDLPNTDVVDLLEVIKIIDSMSTKELPQMVQSVGTNNTTAYISVKKPSLKDRIFRWFKKITDWLF